MVAVRAAVGARAQYLRGEQALALGQVQEGIFALGRAMRFGVPPWANRAEMRLHKLAIGAQREQDQLVATLAWSELRQAILGTRRFGIDPALLSEANQYLNKYSGIAISSRIPGANPVGSILSIAGLSLWIGAAWLTFRPRLWGLGMALFLVGLAIA